MRLYPCAPKQIIQKHELERAGFRVTFAQHYDRPTRLADKETGILAWIAMFGKVFFENIEEKEERLQIAQDVQNTLKPALFHEDAGFADYKRIRVVTIK